MSKKDLSKARRGNGMTVANRIQINIRNSEIIIDIRNLIEAANKPILFMDGGEVSSEAYQLLRQAGIDFIATSEDTLECPALRVHPLTFGGLRQIEKWIAEQKNSIQTN